MLQGQMLRGNMSPWQLEFVLNVHRNLPSKFHQNRVSNSWDIADIEFVWGGGVGFAKSFYCQTQPCVEVRLGFWQFLCIFIYEPSLFLKNFLYFQTSYQMVSYKKDYMYVVVLILHLTRNSKWFSIVKYWFCKLPYQGRIFWIMFNKFL